MVVLISPLYLSWIGISQLYKHNLLQSTCDHFYNSNIKYKYSESSEIRMMHLQKIRKNAVIRKWIMTPYLPRERTSFFQHVLISSTHEWGDAFGFPPIHGLGEIVREHQMDPAPKRTSRKGEIPYIATMGSNVSDAFFYHELCRTCGSDIAYLWLHAQLSGRSKGGTGNATCTPNRSPHSSAPTTPRGRTGGLPFPPAASKSSQIKEEDSSVVKDENSSATFSVSHTQNADQRQQGESVTLPESRASELSSLSSLHSGDTNIGLLYTDAAHTILDSQKKE